MSLRLVIFDVDGTLIDSIAHIETVMARAFTACDLEVPAPGAVRALIGVSLPGLLAQLRPDLGQGALDHLARTYMQMFAQSGTQMPITETAPLFPGTREMLDRLAARDDLLLAVATGKSRRGLNRMLEGHALGGYFVSQQVADDHPSKPHPSMVNAALGEVGIAPADAVVVGDTTYDMVMAREAGVAGIGVSWGNHTPDILSKDADRMIGEWDALDRELAERWGVA